MQRTFDSFILSIPRLYIKQFAYAVIFYVVLWTWPPTVSIAILFVIPLGMALLEWRYAAWMRSQREEHAPTGGKFYIDTPQFPVMYAVRNISLLIVFCALVSYFIQGRFGLSFWQFFFILAGFTVLYRNFNFFGSRASYIITARGIAIYFAQGHLDYPLFLSFSEIREIEKCRYKKDEGWSFMGRLLTKEDGLLIHAKSSDGFSRRLKKVFIIPGDMTKFLEQLPYGLLRS